MCHRSSNAYLGDGKLCPTANHSLLASYALEKFVRASDGCLVLADSFSSVYMLASNYAHRSANKYWSLGRVYVLDKTAVDLIWLTKVPAV